MFSVDSSERQKAFLTRLTAPASSASSHPRLLIVLAHPDDEVLAMGARLERLTASRILTITDGAPANGADAEDHGFTSLAAYRSARRGEVLAALAHAGLGAEVMIEFANAVPDQSASFHLTSLTRAIAREIERFQPETVLTHPYEGGHPDHDACAFAVHAALRLMSATVPVLEAPFYHVGEGGSMQTGMFLPNLSSLWSREYELNPQEREKKSARLACFGSQAETLAQFRVDRELFRIAPTYDFSRRPHPGQLFYEQFPWGMTGDHFCSLAVASLRELFEGEDARTEEPGDGPRTQAQS